MKQTTNSSSKKGLMKYVSTDGLPLSGRANDSNNKRSSYANNTIASKNRNQNINQRD